VTVCDNGEVINTWKVVELKQRNHHAVKLQE
jgi:hypothetical protein